LKKRKKGGELKELVNEGKQEKEETEEETEEEGEEEG